jgi:hypothetical protein
MINLKELKQLAVEALEFYGNNQNWLYNQIKNCDCDIQNSFNGRKIPNGLEFESGGKLAREIKNQIKDKLGLE